MRARRDHQEVRCSRPALWSSLVAGALFVVAGCQQAQLDLVDGSSTAFGANREPIAENTSTTSGPPLQKVQASSADVDSASTPPKSAAGRSDTTVAEILNRAHREAAMNQLAQAERDYRRVLEREPDNVVANHRLAVLADRKQDFATAEAHYLAALRHDRNNADLLSDMGYSYLLQGRRQESERYLLAATRLNPKHDKALHNLSLLYAMLGDYDRSLAALSRAVGESQARIKIAELFPNGRPEVPADETVVASFDPSAAPKAVAASGNASSVVAPAISQPRPAQSGSTGEFNSDVETVTIIPAGQTRKEESRVAAPAQTDVSAPPAPQSPLARQFAELVQQDRDRAIEERTQHAPRDLRATDRTSDVASASFTAPAVAAPPVRGSGQQPVASSKQADFESDKTAAPRELPSRRVPDNQINDIFAAIDREDVQERQPVQENSRRDAVGAGRNSTLTASFSTIDRADGIAKPRGRQADPLESMPSWPSAEVDAQQKFTKPNSNVGLAGAGRARPRSAIDSDYGAWPASAGGSTVKADDRDAERAAALIGMDAGPESMFPTISARQQSSAVVADRTSQDGRHSQTLPTNAPHIQKRVAPVSASVEDDFFSDVRHASDSYDSADPHRKPVRNSAWNQANAQVLKPVSAAPALDPWPGGHAVPAAKAGNQTSPADWPAATRPSLKPSPVSAADADFGPADETSIPDWPGLSASSRAGGSPRGAQP